MTEGNFMQKAQEFKFASSLKFVFKMLLSYLTDLIHLQTMLTPEIIQCVYFIFPITVDPNLSSTVLAFIFLRVSFVDSHYGKTLLTCTKLRIIKDLTIKKVHAHKQECLTWGLMVLYFRGETDGWLIGC